MTSSTLQRMNFQHAAAFAHPTPEQIAQEQANGRRQQQRRERSRQELFYLDQLRLQVNKLMLEPLTRDHQEILRRAARARWILLQLSRGHLDGVPRSMHPPPGVSVWVEDLSMVDSLICGVS